MLLACMCMSCGCSWRFTVPLPGTCALVPALASLVLSFPDVLAWCFSCAEVDESKVDEEKAKADAAHAAALEAEVKKQNKLAGGDEDDDDLSVSSMSSGSHMSKYMSDDEESLQPDEVRPARCFGTVVAFLDRNSQGFGGAYVRAVFPCPQRKASLIVHTGIVCSCRWWMRLSTSLLPTSAWRSSER